MSRIDADLLDSPYAEPPRRGPSAGIWAVIVLCLVVAGVAVATRLLAASQGDESAISDSGDNEVAPAFTLALVDYSGDPAILTHPRRIPEGWEMCSQTDDRFEPDRFCGHTPSQWIETSYTVAGRSNPATAVPTELPDGVWLNDDDPLELRFPINEHVAMTVRTSGVDALLALEIAGSVPIIASRSDLYGSYELPIDWDASPDTDLADILGEFEPDAVVERARFEFKARTSNAALYGFSTRSFWTPVAATDLPNAHLVNADRPLVVGASEELGKGYAVWDQAGFAWRLEGNLNADEVAELALSVMTKLSDLPLDVSR